MSQAADDFVAAAGPIDSRIEIVTPENIAFHYELAGPGRRVVAYLADVALRGAIVIVAGIALLFAGRLLSGLSTAVFLVLWLGLSWFYGGLFETFWNGQTPGKWLMGLRVITREGQPINALQAVLRNVLRDVDGMPFFTIGALSLFPTCALGLLTMTFTDRFARWGDLACGTMVVVERRRLFRGVAMLDHPQIKAIAAALPSNFTASPSLARALSAYVDRRRLFSAGRRMELAQILGEPLVERFRLPPETNHDGLLCALYYHTFIASDGAGIASVGAGNASDGASRAAAPAGSGVGDDDPLSFLRAGARRGATAAPTAAGAGGGQP